MIAQLSQREPFGRPASSSSGVRSAGSLPRNSGVLFFPQTSTSSKSSPAARTKMRAVRLLTLGFRMLSVFAAIDPPCLAVGIPRRSVPRERRPRSPDERLDRVREMRLRNVVVPLIDAQPVRLEEHVRVRVAERRVEPGRRTHNEPDERVLGAESVAGAT